ncbi:hypothetical protein K6V98_00070 [Collinsella sp. AGMB00827]|uniref:Tyr recombinase domain-containing protein n=1 Tax=Collinsella ureilytica TaxID=2869515 RepID=A0ABS7MHH9_9ACTN|nr:hypothetical protein [Collinsella urealyticum]MBY4796768.1 hypothetical protein [Collinsella urealyticum]
MPRKAMRRAWGSVTEVKRGKKYVIRWQQNTDQGRKRKSKTIYGSYRDACLALDQRHVNLADDAPMPTVGEVCERWYRPWLTKRFEAGEIKAGSLDLYVSKLVKHVLPRWKNTPVDSIKLLAVQEWISSLTAHQASICILILRKIVDMAVKYEIIPVNKLLTKFDMPTKNSRTKTKRIYTLSEANDMFYQLRGTIIEAPFILSCFGSARAGESIAVKREEVRRAEASGIEFAIVPIRRRIDKLTNAPTADGDLKTSQSMRELIIPEPYGTRLLEIAETGYVQGSEWLSPKEDGATMSHSAFFNFWIKYGGKNRIPWSNLRTSWRTFAQMEWGIDYDTLELLMGHQLPGVTGAHYLRPSTVQLLARVAEALSTL